MKIRRKSEKGAESDGVPPLHTLITCTYQKLFKKDGDHGGGDNGAVVGGTHGTVDGGKASTVQRHKKHRHDSVSWANGRRELEVKEVDNLDVGRHGDGDVHDFAQDLHEAHNNPLFSKRRKVKSTRYTEFSEEMINMSTPHNTKADKRSRNTEKYIEEDNADYVSTVANSKEALIASIFFVFDTLGKNGLTASEVVAIMLEQNLPGLKEGGARHTVQVANVLRRSRHFISIGNKQYLPCSVAEVPKQEAKKQGHSRNGQSSKSKQGRADCKLYDGSGWHCPRQAQHAFSLCLHHLDMINRPFGKMSVTPSIKGSPVHVREVSNSQRVESEESESDPGENEDIGPAAIARWGKDRTPGSMPNQKRKMLSLMSIK
ncbi:uncharacterized protein [Physcomitrium patens]|uniref:WRC domain-containing protein n=2 Tax=Physcomitrium patens TaxID=3218 RepID=A0A2K1IMI6_PHYPA|nr:uncharacterized protein LOC112274634 [Physcomitrium patens]PNR30488.1 hypothetical protein PHYPA_026804 [Physcomitrium patens]|eukprot:XP_024360043.1 uncharacterized protein LOC112274634 [Physcomitrella patens]